MFLTRGIIFTGVTLKTMQEKFLPFVGVVTVLFFLSPVLVGAADTPQLNVKIGNTGASAIFKAVSCTGGYCTIGWIGDYMDPNTFMDMWVTGGGNTGTIRFNTGRRAS